MNRTRRPAVTRHGEGRSTVVLVHGTCGSGRDWDLVVPLLAEHAAVVVVDRRAATRLLGEPPYSLDVEAADLAGIVAGLDPPVHLVGHSYGAMCALAAAGRVPVASLVLYEPPAAPDRVPLAALRHVTGRLGAGDLDGAALGFLDRVARIPAEELAVLQAVEPVWSTITGHVHTVPAEAAAVMRWSAAAHPPVAAPALLLRGELTDAPIYREGEANVRAVLHEPALAVLEGQRHLAVGFDPGQFAALVLDHLAAVAAG